MLRSLHPLRINPTLRSTKSSRGFTLIELLTVVTIVGVLATVGVVMFRGQLRATRSVEAVAVIQAIRAAEERFRSENKTYLNVSVSGNYYPQNRSDGASFDSKSFSFQATTHPDLAAWQALAPAVNTPVQFGYKVNAGAPGAALPVLDGAITPGAAWGLAPNEAWYVIQAKADLDADGTVCRYVGTSFAAALYSINVGE